MFLMWLGEQITERGLGNGISIIIFAGIAAGLPNAIGGTLELVRTGAMHPLAALLIVVLVVGGDGVRRVRRARPAQDPGELRQAPGRATRSTAARLAPAAQAQHVGRDPADLRLVDHPVPGDARSAGSAPARACAGCRTSPATLSPGPADLRAAVRGARSSSSASSTRRCVQPEGDGRQPEEERRLRPGHPAGRADRALHRQDPDAPDAGGRDLRHAGVPAAGVPDLWMERAVLLRRHLAADHRGRDDGLHGAGAGLRDDAPVREPAEEGEFQGRPRFPVR